MKWKGWFPVHFLEVHCSSSKQFNDLEGCFAMALSDKNF